MCHMGNRLEEEKVETGKRVRRLYNKCETLMDSKRSKKTPFLSCETYSLFIETQQILIKK